MVKITQKIILCLLLTSADLAWADQDPAAFGPPLREGASPVSVQSRSLFDLNNVLPRRFQSSRNSLGWMLAQQSPVKSQGSRGTCSIFSAAALLESWLIRSNLNQEFSGSVPDLSEQWLEYLVNRNGFGGSTSAKNFRAFRSWGVLSEADLPYNPDDWEEDPQLDVSGICKNVPDQRKAQCLLVQQDPRLFEVPGDQLNNPESPFFNPTFLYQRQRSSELRHLLRLSSISVNFMVPTEELVKARLQGGVPLTLDLDVFYGAWAHRLAGELGIGRNMDQWDAGIVGYPEPGSLDRANSKLKPAGHSVVVIGYDDDLVVTVRQKMQSGLWQNFEYRGVYYFKNSWGTEGFGKSILIDGVPASGYGIITQKYAHEFGSFFQLLIP